jgi:hypothetical protein
MAGITNSFEGRGWARWRMLMWGTALLLLLTPAIVMQFRGTGFDWDETDFIVFGIMLALACGTVELASRMSGNGAYRMGVIVAVGVSFITVWANLAVGMIRSEDNPYNLWFGGVLALALLGAVLARFQARGMALAMLIAGAAQLAVAAIGYSSDPRGGIFSMMFMVPWVFSAALFRHAVP